MTATEKNQATSQKHSGYCRVATKINFYPKAKGHTN